jgi:peptide deformylase
VSTIDPQNLRLVRYPDPILALPSRKVEQFTPELRELAEGMFRIMYAARGVGLAGPQAGVSLRIFVTNPNGEPGEGERVYVNPEIMDSSGQEVGEEGCLSLPGITCKLKRATCIVLRAQDLDGRIFEETGEGLLARIFQHESDHLDGILIANKMSVVARLANRNRLKELEEEHLAQVTSGGGK